MSSRQVLPIIIAIVVVIVIIGAIGWATSTFLLWDWRTILAGLRDVTIILLAVGSLFSLIAIALLLLQILQAIHQIREEIQPALEAIRETTGNVRGTTTFVSETTVEPIVKVISTASAVSRFAQVLVRGSNGNKP